MDFMGAGSELMIQGYAHVQVMVIEFVNKVGWEGVSCEDINVICGCDMEK